MTLDGVSYFLHLPIDDMLFPQEYDKGRGYEDDDSTFRG